MTFQSHTHNPERQRNRYRAPVHHVHSLVPGGSATAALHGDSQPQAFIGTWGSISIDMMNQLLRVHDDVTPGGVGVSPLFAPQAVVAPMWPFMPLEWGPVTINPGSGMTFTHNFGRFPSVQFIDSTTGAVLAVQVIHALDRNSFVIQVDTTATGYVVAV